MFIFFFVIDLMVSIDFVLRTCAQNYYCKSLNKQSPRVQEQINPFYINSYGENSFGLRTTFSNELSLWTEVWLYMDIWNCVHWWTEMDATELRPTD